MAKKVLFVDDEEDILMLLEATVGNDDRFQVLLARDGNEALVIAQGEQPDLIFLDIMMPGKDGYQVCQELRSRYSESPATVIMLTALARESARRKAKEAGADDFFTKPFSPTALLEKLEGLMGS
jgi:DNA-binding response OmpR family regulator